MRIWALASAVFAAVPAVWGLPSIYPKGVVNATGYQNKLAPGVVFAIFGQGMGPGSIVFGSAPNYQEALAGTSITFAPSGGGAAVNAKMVYTLAGQVAGHLPSSIAPGTYQVRVTYNGETSAPEEVTVVARSFGIATANGGGTGPAQATNGNVNNGISLVRFTPGGSDFGGFHWVHGPAHAGNSLVFWGTGGGADAANDTGGTSGDQTAAGNFMVTVGGRQIRPFYAGASSGYPGLWQINFTLPADIDLGCYASAQVSAGGELSNAVTIAIAAPGETACVDPGLSRESLAKLDAGGKIVGAGFGIIRGVSTTPAVTQEFGSGAFSRWTAAQWAAAAPTRPPLGQCRVYDRTYPVGGRDPAEPEIFLDAGARLALSGPGLPSGAAMERMTTQFGASYAYLPAFGTFQALGRYSLTGNGGTDVGPFTVGARFPEAFTVTNWDSITVIDRSQPVIVIWEDVVDFVTIVIGNNTRTGSNIHIVTVACYVEGGADGFLVPVSALSQLLPPPADAFISVQGYNSEPFSANLVAGGQIDFGAFAAGFSVAKNLPVQ